MAVGKLNKEIKYANVNVGGLVVGPKAFINYDTGVVPETSEFQAVSRALSWVYILNAWVADNHIWVTLANPMDFEVTLDSWNSIRIFWL